ncbi:MAG: noncanonical pyrimidine nucleotidase, YjjG family [Verrucomicrobia bacterium]|nr:noncanonical pyrimidine nucleotidase, YjjG family [Cytophagales bacterium]
MYSHLFFDLDHTLWDFEKNANETLSELFEKYNFKNTTTCSETDFLETMHNINRELWQKHDANEISQTQLRKDRFPLIFKACNINLNEKIMQEFGNSYMKICPTKPHLIPFTKEILDTLISKQYKLFILTNGFADTQPQKLKSSGILPYFEKIITPQHAGAKKPDKAMFEYALQQADIQPQHALMIGDTPETDILGGKNATIDTVWYNPKKLVSAIEPTYQINCLKDLLNFL